MELLYAQEFLTHKIVFYNIKGVKAPWTYCNCRIFDSRFRSFIAGAYDQFSPMVLISDVTQTMFARMRENRSVLRKEKSDLPSIQSNARENGGKILEYTCFRAKSLCICTSFWSAFNCCVSSAKFPCAIF